MTWEQTHRRQRILREVERAAASDPSGRLPWRDEYAALFGGPAGLLAALRYRWQLRLDAQIDPGGPDAAVEMERASARLVAQNAGLLRILRRYPRSDGDPAGTLWEERYVTAS